MGQLVCHPRASESSPEALHVRPSLPEEPTTALDTRTRTVHQDLKKGSSPRPDALGLQLRCAPLLTSL